MMQVAVEVHPEFRAGVPRPLFQTNLWSAGGVTNGYRWAISADGRRFVINKATKPVAETITVLVASPDRVR